MTFTLRPYQQELVDRTAAAMAAGGVPALICPTGGGKSVMIAELARLAIRAGHRVVAVAHRQEIVQQLMASLRSHMPPRTRMELITAGRRARYDAQVTIGMVPTMARRLGGLDALRGAVMLCDEAHHCGARSWASVISAIRPAMRCGFTATPVRPNGRGLGDEGGFTELVVGPQVAELIEMGALAPYRLFASPNRITTEGLRLRAGEFRQADLEARVIAINGSIVADWQRWGQGQKTITVCVGIDHAREVAERFLAAGIAAATVSGETPKAERDRIFESFRSGSLLVLTACAVVDEGLDVPAATVLQLTRPTASLRLYRQLVGRVLRPAPGKDAAIILDHTDTCFRLPAPDEDIEWSLHADARPSGPPRLVSADPITAEITLQPLSVAELAEQELAEITPEQLRRAKPRKARVMLAKRAASEIALVAAGQAPPMSLMPWLGRLAVLDQETAEALGAALGYGAGWGQQSWERAQAVVSGDRLNRLTKRLQLESPQSIRR